MRDFSRLLKKVEQFERLALHGDRKAFLQSLGQTTDITKKFGPEVRAQLGSVLDDMYALGIKSSEILTPVASAKDNFDNANISELIKALEAATTVYPRETHGTQLQNLQNLISTLRGSASSTSPTVTTLPETLITSPPVTRLPETVITTLTPISKSLQKAISDMAVANKIISVPLDIDGKLGPKTQAAINGLKKKYNMQDFSNKSFLEFVNLKTQNKTQNA